MVEPIRFKTDTDLAEGLLQLVRQLQDTLDLKTPLKMFIAGGMACHLYTAGRVTTDVDAEFSKRFVMPSDLLVETKAGNMLYLDSNYNSTFALMHEDYLEDAIKVPLGTDLIDVYVLSPVDLIVSKIARLSGPDRSDIESIIGQLHVSAEDIEHRANDAMIGYVGNVSNLKQNLIDVLAIARNHAQHHAAAHREAGHDFEP